MQEEELEQTRRERPSATPVPIEFPARDPRLQFKGEQTMGKRRATLMRGDEQEDVICVPIDQEDMKPGQHGPRYVDIYNRISAATLVQRFYGIGHDKKRKPFAVMQNLQGLPTLASFIASDSYPADVFSRLRFAYDIACTIAYLHEAQILVKNLADDSIVFVQKGTGYKPVICELEQARLFLEPTTSIAYDVRYEAPEYIKMETHSKHTDIWSLGIVLWQCVTAGKPFDRADPVDPKEAAASVIRSTLSSKSLGRILSSTASAQDPNLLYTVMELIKSCCNFIPTCRPPAAQVAQSIFNIWARQSIDMPSSQTNHVGIATDIEARIWEIVTRKRKDRGLVVRPGANDISSLKASTAQGNAVSAFFFGALILYDAVDDIKLDNLDDSGSEPEIAGEEQRARSALTHLEFSMAAGVSEATREAAAAHHSLAKLYAERHKRFSQMH